MIYFGSAVYVIDDTHVYVNLHLVGLVLRAIALAEDQRRCYVPNSTTPPRPKYEYDIPVSYTRVVRTRHPASELLNA